MYAVVSIKSYRGFFDVDLNAVLIRIIILLSSPRAPGFLRMSSEQKSYIDCTKLTPFCFMSSKILLKILFLVCFFITKHDSLKCLVLGSNAQLTQEAGEGRTTHNNGWNGVEWKWKPCVWCVWYHSIYSVPVITLSPSSPIKLPPATFARQRRQPWFYMLYFMLGPW